MFQGDIMAQQLKFIACLKIMMEELSTLATGFEVDGGQLRYQLYIWLEKEVQVLKNICSYGLDIDATAATPQTSGKYTVESLRSVFVPFKNGFKVVLWCCLQ